MRFANHSHSSLRGTGENTSHRHLRPRVKMNFRLFDVNQLSRTSDVEGHDYRQRLRHTQTDICDAYQIVRPAPFGLRHSAHMQFKLRFAKMTCLHLPSKAKFKKILAHSLECFLVSTGFPSCKHPSHIALEFAGKLSSECCYRIAALWVPSQSANVDDIHHTINLGLVIEICDLPQAPFRHPLCGLNIQETSIPSNASGFHAFIAFAI